MEEQQRAQIENYVKSYNVFDINGMMRDLDDRIVFQNYTGDEMTLYLTGLEAFKQQATASQAYFTNRKQVITSWHFDQHKVKVEIDYEAVLATDLPNGMKAGDTFQLQGQSVFTFRNSKIIKIEDRS